MCKFRRFGPHQWEVNVEYHTHRPPEVRFGIPITPLSKLECIDTYMNNFWGVGEAILCPLSALEFTVR